MRCSTTRAARLTALGSKSFLIEADARRAQAYVLEGRHGEAAELAAALRSTGCRRPARPACARPCSSGCSRSPRSRRGAPRTAPAHFAESLRLGREFGADYEVARTLQAKVLTGFADDAELEEAEAIMERLGVVSFPDVPLP